MKRKAEKKFLSSNAKREKISIFEHIKNNDIEKIKESLLDYNLVNDGIEAFMYSLKLGYTEIAQILIPYANLSFNKMEANEALRIAVFNDYTTIIDSLAVEGADINIKDDYGNILIKSYVLNKHINVDTLKSLIGAGAILSNVDEEENNLWQFIENKRFAEHTKMTIAFSIFGTSEKETDELHKQFLSEDKNIKIIDNINAIIRSKDNYSSFIYLSEEDIKFAVYYFIGLLKSKRIEFKSYVEIRKCFEASTTLNDLNNELFKQSIIDATKKEMIKAVDAMLKVEGSIQYHLYGATNQDSKYLAQLNEVQKLNLSNEDMGEVINKIVKELENSLINLMQAKKNGLNYIASSVIKLENQLKNQNDEQKSKELEEFSSNFFKLDECLIVNKKLTLVLSELGDEFEKIESQQLQVLNYQNNLIEQDDFYNTVIGDNIEQS